MESRQSKGGKSRAESLSPEQRKQIASEAAKARWDQESKLPRATHVGTLTIGDAEIACAVLEDGRRVLTQEGFLDAIGRARKAKGGQGAASGEVDKLPAFLAAKNLNQFISNELLQSTTPIIFRGVTGGKGFGYAADLLPRVCDVYLAARQADKLLPSQDHIASQCEMLVRALAKVGVIALVDEATGYQDARDRDELHRLLAVYLAEERLAWAKRFPDEFYKQIYRLKGWGWPVGNAKTPFLGHITNDIVYERLPTGVIDKLRELNPTNEDTKRRKWKHHQFLSAEVGQPDLRDHILQILPLMRISKDWSTFKRHLDAAFPKKGTQFDLLPDER